MFKLDLEKAEEPEIKLQTSVASQKTNQSFKLGFNSTWTENFQMYKLDLEKAEEPEIKLSTPIGS